MMGTINHGTRGGYYAHRRLSEPPCDECRTAINQYLRDYRAQKGLARNRANEKVRRQALAVLRDRHREEYDKIIDEIKNGE